MPLTFDEFPVPTLDEWRKVAEASLKGKPFDTLITETIEGIDLRPLYDANHIELLTQRLAMPAPTANPMPWRIAQTLSPELDPEAFHQHLQTALENGQTAVSLDYSPSVPWLNQLSRLEAALADVNWSQFPLYIRTGLNGLPLLAMIHASRKMNPQSGYIGDDPYALQTRYDDPLPLRQVLDFVAQATTASSTTAIGTLLVRGDVYQDSGAHAVQELAFVLASAVQQIRDMQARDVPAQTAFRKMHLLIAIGPQFFTEIAKLRALRWLWSQIVTAFGLDVADYPPHIHARSAQWNKTRLDAHTNLLRTTTEGIAAAVAGVESLDLFAFDALCADRDTFSERLARNQQIIMQQEAHLAQVADSAAGSYYVECLTDQLAQHAWTLFQQVEAKGGFAEAVKTGWVQSHINETRQLREKRIMKRQDVLIGVNLYANLDESVSSTQVKTSDEVITESNLKVANYSDAKKALSKGAYVPDVAASLGLHLAATPRHGCHAAAYFESLRDNMAAHHHQTGQVPRIFLMNMGSPVSYKVRADFVRSFLEVGGFDVIDQGGFDTIGSAIKAVVDANVQVAVICSTDALYKEIVEPLARSLKHVQPDIRVILAGYPPDEVPDFETYGIDAFIHAQANIYAINQQLQEWLGVSS